MLYTYYERKTEDYMVASVTDKQKDSLKEM